MQQELGKLTGFAYENLILETKFPVKIKDIHKIEREEKFQSAFQKNT